MKATLQKTENGYGLKEMIAFVSSVRPEHKYHKLSLKNCQAIEFGYNLDELAENAYPWKDEGNKEDYIQDQRRYGFKKGFQKALEILGDKKFSERQLRKVIAEARLCVADDDSGVKFLKEDFVIIQSIQQTEWDVEVEMECPQCKEWGYISECRNNCNQKFLQPKLDVDGCLILKRI